MTIQNAPIRTTIPSSPRLKLLAAVLAAAGAPAALAAPCVGTFTNTIDNATVTVAPNSTYSVNVGESLCIGTTGELNAPSRAEIVVDGSARNEGRLRAAFSSEHAGIVVRGTLDNAPPATPLDPFPTVQTWNFDVRTGGQVGNEGLLVTGRYRYDPVTFPTVVAPTPTGGWEAVGGFSIEDNASVLNTGTGVWASFGNGTVLGSLTNESNFFSQNSAETLPPGSLPYRQVITVGSPLQAGLGLIDNAATGDFVLGADTTLSNFGAVTNAGRLSIDGRLENLVADGAPGSFSNFSTGAVLVNGEFFGGAVENSGRIEVAGVMGLDRLQHRDGLLLVNQSGVLTGRIFHRGGEVWGTGTINGDGIFVGGGVGVARFNPGFSPGHMDVNALMEFIENGELILEIERAPDGSLAWDTLFAQSLSFGTGSTIRVVVGAGVILPGDQTFDFITCGGNGCDFDLTVPTLEIVGGDGELFLGGDGRLMFRLAGSGAVPEPASVPLLLAGLAGLLFSRRRGTRRISGA